ncbi:MAG TPA: TIGR01777 family oxidoreductase [Candidatus Acidoferrales bacterium]|nr:TIGR01777 family oxidoreductase [Candidatus Acidoferrales bacterium]
MRILMSGGSGFVGTALTRLLRASGHNVSHLVRAGASVKPPDVLWDPRAASIDAASVEGTDAVVHLSGASIADGRWTPARKAELRSSRVDTTRVLVDTILNLRQKPRAFVCASAIGYYGDRGDEILTESSPCGTDFLALLARDWEAEAERAAHAGIRVAQLRFGVIFDAQGGALPKMLAPIRWGVGGRLGSGRQWISWVTLEDAVDVARNALLDDRYSGPINVVAPNPVRNLEFTRIAARMLHRPAIIPAPKLALSLALGEMAQPLLLASTHAKPERLLQLGYAFRSDNIKATLQKMIGEQRS